MMGKFSLIAFPRPIWPTDKPINREAGGRKKA